MDIDADLLGTEQDIRAAEEKSVALHSAALFASLPPVREQHLACHAYSARSREFDGGTGTPLVLLHGLGTDWRFWLGMVRHLIPRYKVILLELRHHGDAADAPAAGTIDDYANDVDAALTGLGIASATICGLSMGGAVAQHFALRFPARVAELWLLATIAKGFPALAERAAAGERLGIEAQLVPTLARWFTPETLAQNAYPVRYARQTLRRLTVSGWAASWRALASVDALGRLHHIRVPVHVVAGELDTSATPELMSAIAEQIPAARFSMLPGAAHMLALEAPDALAKLLLADG